MENDFFDLIDIRTEKLSSHSRHFSLRLYLYITIPCIIINIIWFRRRLSVSFARNKSYYVESMENGRVCRRESLLPMSGIHV